VRASHSAARISVLDVNDLDRASTKLALVANNIRAHKVVWGDPLVEHLIDANNVVERIRIKGAKAFANYYQRHGLPAPDAAAPEAQEGEIASADVPKRENEEES